MKIAKILVPVDFSPASRLALRYGVVFARKFSSALIVTHIVEGGSALDRVLAPLSLMAREEQAEEAERLLPALLSDRNRAELNPRFVVETGPVSSRILSASRREKADLVIMGTHGRGLIHRSFMGSVTLDVLRSTDTPVLTLSHTGNPQPIRRILLATKLTPEFDEVARFTESFAHLTNARLIAFHAVDVGVENGAEEATYLGQTRVAEARSTLQDLFAHSNDTLLEARIAEHSIPAAILKGAMEHDADIIVVGTPKGKGGGRSALTSTSERIIQDASVPVLSVPTRAISKTRQAA